MDEIDLKRSFNNRMCLKREKKILQLKLEDKMDKRRRHSRKISLSKWVDTFQILFQIEDFSKCNRKQIKNFRFNFILIIPGNGPV
jgi:hypothetical protein